MDIRRFSSALLPLVMLLQACSSTPFGQQLSESFDGQDAADLPTAAGSQAAASQVAASQPQQAETKETKDDRTDRAAEQETPRDQTSAERQRNSSDKPVPTADVQPTDVQPTDVQPTNVQPATARAVPERTRPYRITIRLSAADPAAPAEGVTEALRRAGIGFEVETIEKVPARELNQSSSIQPSSTQQQPAS